MGLVSYVKGINLNPKIQVCKNTTFLFCKATVDLCLVGPNKQLAFSS